MFNIPKQPKVRLKPALPDQRQIAVMPLRALKDRSLDNAAIRVLGLLCSYCNRAGITWVGQDRLAQDLGVTRPAITRQLISLRKSNYIKTIVQGGKNSHTSTTRVIFNADIGTDDAMATMSDESRSPQMIEEEQQTMSTVPLKATRTARKTIKLPVKAQALEVLKKASGNELVTHNNCEGIVQEVYRSVYLNEKVINDLDLKGFEMIGMCGMTEQMLRRDLEIWLKARTSPPDSILDLARALLDEQSKAG